MRPQRFTYSEYPFSSGRPGPRARGRRGDFGPERRGGHRHGGPGPGHDFGSGFGPFGPGFGPGWDFGPGRGRGGRRRAGRGEIRAAILLLLAEQPRHGYQIITELAERSEGRWRPSPGAVYPALAQLQDEGLVALSDDGGRRLADLTEAGRAYVEEHRDELGTPWEAIGGGRPLHGRELFVALRGLAGAVEQVARTGTTAQAEAARTVVDRARREIYLVLAGDDPHGSAPDEQPTAQ